MTPTPFGEIVLRHGERAAAEVHELMREVALAKGLEIGELASPRARIPRTFRASGPSACCRRSIPTCLLNCEIVNYTRAVADVSEGAVDIGFAEVSEAQSDANLEVLSARNRQLLFFCGAEHPLAGNRPLAIEDLLDFPWVGPSVAGRLRKALPVIDKPFGTFDELEDQFHPRILVETFSTAKRGQGGLGIGAAVPLQGSSPSSRRDGA